MYEIDWQQVGERLVELRKKLKIKSGRQFALSLTVNGNTGDPSYLAKAEKGSTLSDTYIKAMQDRYGMNPDWLKFGRGEMFVNPPQNVPHGTNLEKALESIRLWQIDIDARITVLTNELAALISAAADKSISGTFSQLKKDIDNERSNLMAAWKKEQ